MGTSGKMENPDRSLKARIAYTNKTMRKKFLANNYGLFEQSAKSFREKNYKFYILENLIWCEYGERTDRSDTGEREGR